MNRTFLSTTVKAFLALVLLSLSLSTSMPSSIYAQNGFSPATVDTIWTFIKVRMDQRPSNATPAFILDLVRNRCDQDFDCLYRTYDSVVFKLERHFQLPAAIYVCEEMADLARRHGDLEAEAKACKNLNRYHDALGNERLAVINIDKAVKLFGKAGNQSALITAKMNKLEQSLSHRMLEDVLFDMDTLLTRAVAMGDTLNESYLLNRLALITLEAGCFETAARYVAALEALPLSEPIRQNEYGRAIITALGRAELAWFHYGNLQEAECFYQEALALCRAEPSRWLEIHMLHSLTQLEWERDNAPLAKAYLDSAQVKAAALRLYDLLATGFELQAKIAEAESRYADALASTKQKYACQAKFESRSAGFDARSYYLQLEKDQLAVEKKNQTLELSLKKSQLRSSLIITGLIFLLAAGLFIGLYKQRRGKQELTRQHALIRQQAERLQSLDAAKTRFFANVSHELRTPLTLVLSPLRTLLRETRLPEKEAGLLRTAVRNGNQLEQLINEILDLGKLEMGKMKPDTRPTRLVPFFSRHLAQFESLAQRREIEYAYSLPSEENLTAGIDREKYRQILYNLLSNAFKFTPAGGRVRASVRVEGNELHLTVTDSGPGIHPDDLPHLFDRYFQTNRPDRPAEGGTGIGLALCQEYARLFGGGIEVESIPGEGSTFQVTFPVSLTDAPANAPQNATVASDRVEAPASAGYLGPVPPLISTPLNVRKKTASGKSDAHRPTILVVEDNPELQDYLRLILSGKYEVLTAGNGREALEVLGNHPSPIIHHPSLILSDLMMPVMDGYQLLERLKSDATTRHLPVVMLTARADARDRLKALRIGVDDYLLKPFDEEELLVRIDNLLRNQALRVAASTEDGPGKGGPALPEADREWLESFEAYVQNHLADDHLSVPALADTFAMSESTLLRQLKRLTGLTTNQYLQEMRLDKARRLIEKGRYRTVTEVAAEVGYNDARSFSRTFKKRFGKLPSDIMPA